MKSLDRTLYTKYKRSYTGKAIIMNNSLPEAPKKERWGTNYDKINATHEPHAQRRPVAEEPPWKGQQENYWRKLFLLVQNITLNSDYRVWVTNHRAIKEEI